jgi:hypothetical protein
MTEQPNETHSGRQPVRRGGHGAGRQLRQDGSERPHTAELRVGGVLRPLLRPPPPVAAPLASSLRAPCKVNSLCSVGRWGRVELHRSWGCVALLEALGFVGKTAAPLRELPRMSRLCGLAPSRLTYKEVDVSRMSGTSPASHVVGRSRS